MARIYVASIWRSAYFPEVVNLLQEYEHEEYDFRKPPQGGHSFHWTDIDPHCANQFFSEYADGLTHPAAEELFVKDIETLEWADTYVLVQPCGLSVHTEAGLCKGCWIKIVYIPKMEEPKSKYKLFNAVTDSIEGVLAVDQQNLFFIHLLPGIMPEAFRLAKFYFDIGEDLAVLLGLFMGEFVDDDDGVVLGQDRIGSYRETPVIEPISVAMVPQLVPDDSFLCRFLERMRDMLSES